MFSLDLFFIPTLSELARIKNRLFISIDSSHHSVNKNVEVQLKKNYSSVYKIQKNILYLYNMYI